MEVQPTLFSKHWPLMRTITGAILILAAEQAFAHAHLVGFPMQSVASEVLVPSSMVLAVLGIVFLVWGLLADFRKPSP